MLELVAELCIPGCDPPVVGVMQIRGWVGTGKGQEREIWRSLRGRLGKMQAKLFSLPRWHLVTQMLTVTGVSPGTAGE